MHLYSTQCTYWTPLVAFFGATVGIGIWADEKEKKRKNWKRRPRKRKETIVIANRPFAIGLRPHIKIRLNGKPFYSSFLFGNLSRFSFLHHIKSYEEIIDKTN